jgi:WhiB family transcriptional regulator, redox-sensing transcriptional regulator
VALNLTEPWMSDAACAGADHELFFSESPRRVARAKSICSSCPVRIPCLVDALECNERYGIWGGLTTEERDELVQTSA